MIIEEVRARVIKDSRGQDTIAVSVNGAPEASAPNGKSTGDFETKPYFHNLKWCVDFLNDWQEQCLVTHFNDLRRVERTIARVIHKEYSRSLGANTLFAFESAILKALAVEEQKPLWEIVSPRSRLFPFPVGNIIGGGLHSIGEKKRPNFQEFLAIPKAPSFSKNVEVMKYMYGSVGEQLNGTEVNDEGAWKVAATDEVALDAMNIARRAAIKKFKVPVQIGVDVAGSTLYERERYMYKDKTLNAGGQLDYFSKLIPDFDIFYTEDPFEQSDFTRFSRLTAHTGRTDSLIVGDDLIATQFNRLEKAIRTRAVRGMIVKPNQNGSLLEVARIMTLCRRRRIATIMSHRSGETMDDALADYAFGFGANYIKCGVATKWREAKLNRMIEIEKSLTI